MSIYNVKVDAYDLVGEIFTTVKQVDEFTIAFVREDGSGVVQTHAQECCEDVHVEDITGDLSDLENRVIIHSEEVSNEPTLNRSASDILYEQWTFYKISTINGGVTIRWYGASNGCYSTDVPLYELTKSQMDTILK